MDHSLITELEAFREFGRPTRVEKRSLSVKGGAEISVPIFANEFWTAKQRQGNSIHEISYRACFKPQLPRFFIERLTNAGDEVYDPMMGRGTTPLEAALMDRVPIGNDSNPLSQLLVRPRLNPPTVNDVDERLKQIDFGGERDLPRDLLVFYHPATLRQICSLRSYFLRREVDQELDAIDDSIRMIALNRLTGHSPGFFSVYTLPPNQAVTVERQKKINEKRNQSPPIRNVPALILEKIRALHKDCGKEILQRLGRTWPHARLLTGQANATPQIPDNSVALVVTSPPFLDVVDYAGDNWLRCWFAGIDPKEVRLTICRNLDAWKQEMASIFRELFRVLKPGGYAAFEVGEVRGGTIKLEEVVIPAGIAAGLEPLLVLINDQEFTKTANCWGINNNAKGTNTNRIVLFRKPPA